MSVAWNTYEQVATPCVSFGESRDNLTLTTCSTGFNSSVTYLTSRTWANTVILRDLKPATRYYYRILSTNSTVDFFQSGRDAGDTTPFAVTVIPDLGVYGEAGYTLQSRTDRQDVPIIDPSLNHTTISNLATTIDSYEAVLHPGDFAYADDWYLRWGLDMEGLHAYQAILEQFYYTTSWHPSPDANYTWSVQATTRRVVEKSGSPL